MPVFISHRTADDDKTQALAYRLKTHHNIQCYLDHFDPETATPRKITDLLLDRINACTHLMALITVKTAGSWWVPFEIGVARHGDRRITSYDMTYSSLPEYLTEWPVLKTQTDLDKFAEAYHKDKDARPIVEKYAAYARTIADADDFHRNLKSNLRRL